MRPGDAPGRIDHIATQMRQRNSARVISPARHGLRADEICNVCSRFDWEL